MGRGTKHSQNVSRSILRLRSRPVSIDPPLVKRYLDDPLSGEVFEQTGYEAEGRFVLHSGNDLPAQVKNSKADARVVEKLWFSHGKISRDPSLGPAVKETVIKGSKTAQSDYFVIDNSLVENKDGFTNHLFEQTDAGRALRERHQRCVGDILPQVLPDGSVVTYMNSRLHSKEDLPSEISTLFGSNKQRSQIIIWHNNDEISRESGPAHITFTRDKRLTCAWIVDGKFVLDTENPNVIHYDSGGTLEIATFCNGRYDPNRGGYNGVTIASIDGSLTVPPVLKPGPAATRYYSISEFKVVDRLDVEELKEETFALNEFVTH